MIFCLCGMVTLKPASGSVRAIEKKSRRQAGETRNGRYTASTRRDWNARLCTAGEIEWRTGSAITP